MSNRAINRAKTLSTAQTTVSRVNTSYQKEHWVFTASPTQWKIGWMHWLLPLLISCVVPFDGSLIEEQSGPYLSIFNTTYGLEKLSFLRSDLPFEISLLPLVLPLVTGCVKWSLLLPDPIKYQLLKGKYHTMLIFSCDVYYYLRVRQTGRKEQFVSIESLSKCHQRQGPAHQDLGTQSRPLW